MQRFPTILAQVQQNRKRLVPIIECVLLCGKEEIPLRSHRYFGKIVIDDMNSREGKFRAILKYKAKGDEHLRNMLEDGGKRNKYTSPIIQNQIIETCNKIILKKIVDRVNSSKCFSILADETTDVATNEQLSLSARYVDDNDILHEDFLKFFEINSLTGSNLASSILNGLNSCGIECDYLYRQGYDGASNMAGKFNGVQAVIRATHPKALYFFAFGLPVCKQLQKERIDLKTTLSTIELLVNTLKEMRQDAEKEIHILYEKLKVCDLSLNDAEKISFENLVEFYLPPVEHDNAYVEIKIWKLKITSQDVDIKSGLEAHLSCPKIDFPNIHFLIKLFCTLPVSTATPKRSFSTLKRLKTYLRSTMNETRLNGLAMMSIHGDIHLDVDEIINEMALSPCKLDFVI
ncbi:zinc finger MYM-type protein 1-like [Acyrthosiphon pisum]|uniref:Uncharacterized protein n=1 Tax=Acyrthosiphon pisum TaxID=7029 RepID=A0A8R2JKN8_ACYPI|nr:zinc finger MYM-type protein 1-like [Acyrthosiphon pisum]